MKIAVLVKLVPDLVEEINIDPSGNALDTTWMRLVINEFDDHSIEQAIILKERDGSQVTIIAPNYDGIDDVLFTAAAKNADQLIKLDGNYQAGVNNHALAKAFSDLLKELQPDLILTGVQANNDLDGSLGSLVAGHLNYPYAGYVSNITSQDGSLVVQKEYPGGLLAEMEVKLPVVLGIQAAEQPPRYVAVSKVRQAMKTSSIIEKPAPELDTTGGIQTTRMYTAEAGEKATMLTGSVDEVANQLIDILKKTGLA
jgi:electron transfer flavoprotein beta subunit